MGSLFPYIWPDNQLFRIHEAITESPLSHGGTCWISTNDDVNTTMCFENNNELFSLYLRMILPFFAVFLSWKDSSIRFGYLLLSLSWGFNALGFISYTALCLTQNKYPYTYTDSDHDDNNNNPCFQLLFYDSLILTKSVKCVSVTHMCTTICPKPFCTYLFHVCSFFIYPDSSLCLITCCNYMFMQIIF